MESTKSFKVITSDDVASQMNRVIVWVNEVLHVSKMFFVMSICHENWTMATF